MFIKTVSKSERLYSHTVAYINKTNYNIKNKTA